eukprot:scaffold23175_cov36-Phaeocystis_antarctica.AAC.1
MCVLRKVAWMTAALLSSTCACSASSRNLRPSRWTWRSNGRGIGDAGAGIRAQAMERPILSAQGLLPG